MAFSKRTEEKTKKDLETLKKGAAFLPLFVALSFFAFLFTRASAIKKASSAFTPLNAQEESRLEGVLDASFLERKAAIHSLPYSLGIPFDSGGLKAESAILISADTGDILFEKNADEPIPPASMTKLFLIYSVLKKEGRGEVSLDQIIPVDQRAYACNMMPHSSLMFLGRGHRVSLLELLQGLSVCSGNDAAYAIAYELYGSMENFIEEINQTIQEMGLAHTKIVESSGYSEENITTAREMASFCRTYITEFPWALENLHSIKQFTYPKEENIPPEQMGRPAQNFLNGIPQDIWTPITQPNTNKLLGVLQGADGIKTGHIMESGYNLALTTTRAGQRFISVTMKGPGSSMAEGDKWRAHDGTALHEWAHSHFKTLPALKEDECTVTVPLYGSQWMSVLLRPAYNRPLSVPKGMETKTRIECPKYIFGRVACGGLYGRLFITDQGGATIQEIPLVAERDSAPANQFVQRCDEIILKFFLTFF